MAVRLARNVLSTILVTSLVALSILSVSADPLTDGSYARPPLDELVYYVDPLPTITTPLCFLEQALPNTSTVTCGYSTSRSTTGNSGLTEIIPSTVEGSGVIKVVINSTVSHGTWLATTRAILVADTTPPECTSPRLPTYVEARGKLTRPLSTDTMIEPRDSVDTALDLTTNAKPLAVDQGRTVLWTVVDDGGNKTTCTERIIVIDRTPPSFPDTLPSVVVTSAVPVSVSSVTLTPPTVIDIVDDDITPYHEEAGMFVLGENTVTWMASDSSLNMSTKDQKVIVRAP